MDEFCLGEKTDEANGGSEYRGDKLSEEKISSRFEGVRFLDRTERFKELALTLG